MQIDLKKAKTINVKPKEICYLAKKLEWVANISPFDNRYSIYNEFLKVFLGIAIHYNPRFTKHEKEVFDKARAEYQQYLKQDQFKDKDTDKETIDQLNIW